MNQLPPLRPRAASVLLLGGLAMFLHSGCQRIEEASAAGKEQPLKKDETPTPAADRFAEDRAPDIKAVPFDGARALEYIKALCAIGPRISGSDGMKKQQEMLQKHFETHGGIVEWQKFNGKQPSQPNAVPMANMIVSWNPAAKRRIILCGHYDTRPIADQEPRERDWRKTFLSANDGTSTVAFMMELAHHMKESAIKIGVDFVIFDGEEFINDNKRDKFFLGSEHFAERYRKGKPEHQYVAAVLLDLFAGKDARFPVEANSFFLAREVVESIWKEAERQQVKSFERVPGPEVQDDHLALNRAGIPAIDIIDFDYKHWHKLTDLPEACSAKTMADVAKVLTAWLQRFK
jgi:glutaminyl-peptide cyclotransferase